MNENSIKENVNVNYFIGTIVLGTLLRDYIEPLETIAKENKTNYLINKLEASNKAVQSLLKVMTERLSKFSGHNILESEIQRNFDLVYDVLALSDVDKKRIAGLVEKIKKGR